METSIASALVRASISRTRLFSLPRPLSLSLSLFLSLCPWPPRRSRITARLSPIRPEHRLHLQTCILLLPRVPGCDMGSLPDDTRCFFCDSVGAAYIPDGCGPCCRDCLEILFEAGGLNRLQNLRYDRFLESLKPVCFGGCPPLARILSECQNLIIAYLIR